MFLLVNKFFLCVEDLKIARFVDLLGDLSNREMGLYLKEKKLENKAKIELIIELLNLLITDCLSDSDKSHKARIEKIQLILKPFMKNRDNLL